MLCCVSFSNRTMIYTSKAWDASQKHECTLLFKALSFSTASEGIYIYIYKHVCTILSLEAKLIVLCSLAVCSIIKSDKIIIHIDIGWLRSKVLYMAANAYYATSKQIKPCYTK